MAEKLEKKTAELTDPVGPSFSVVLLFGGSSRGIRIPADGRRPMAENSGRNVFLLHQGPFSAVS